MKSITIHDLDEPLFSLLKTRARQDNSSLNKTIKKLLEHTLGIKKEPKAPRNDFKEFCGTWSDRDLKDFQTAIKDTEAVNPGDWQ